MIKLLFHRLLNCGYKDSDISPLFDKTAVQIDSKLYHTYTKKKSLRQWKKRIESSFI